MSDERSPLRKFFEDFGKVPEEEPRELIPHDVRIPVFLGIAAVSFVLLILLLWFVVVPAIRASQTPPPHAQAPAALLFQRV